MELIGKFQQTEGKQNQQKKEREQKIDQIETIRKDPESRNTLKTYLEILGSLDFHGRS